MQNIDDLNYPLFDLNSNDFSDYEFSQFESGQDFPNAFIIDEDPPSIENISQDIVLVEEEAENNPHFPFNKGEGVQIVFDKIGIDCKFISESEVNLTKKGIPFKFKTAHYDINEKGEKKKKKQRKTKPDLIRKKIKSRLHKDIKNIINIKLKNAGSCKFFDYLPQPFITNVTKKANKEAFDLTYQKLLETDFKYEKKKETTFIVQYQKADKHKINCEALEYLKNKPEILKNSQFDRIQKMKYKDILKAYFSSKEFEVSLIDLYIKKHQNIGYIQEYVNKSLNYIEFFSN